VVDPSPGAGAGDRESRSGKADEWRGTRYVVVSHPHDACDVEREEVLGPPVSDAFGSADIPQMAGLDTPPATRPPAQFVGRELKVWWRTYGFWRNFFDFVRDGCMPGH